MIPQILVDKVLARARENAAHSWEYGTVFEALLEYRNPQVGVFYNPFPGGKIPELGSEDIEALQYVKPFIQTDSKRLCEGNGKPCDFSTYWTHHEEGQYADSNVRFIFRSNIPLHPCSPPFQVSNVPRV
jgi:hypothetical protein